MVENINIIKAGDVIGKKLVVNREMLLKLAKKEKVIANNGTEFNELLVDNFDIRLLEDVDIEYVFEEAKKQLYS